MDNRLLSHSRRGRIGVVAELVVLDRDGGCPGKSDNSSEDQGSWMMTQPFYMSALEHSLGLCFALKRKRHNQAFQFREE